MDLISLEKRKTDYILKQYNELRKEFEDEAKTIISKLTTALENFGENYGLVNKTDIKSIKYFSVVSRIKEVKSLEEKIFRSDLLYKTFSRLKNDFEDNLQTKNLVKNCIRDLDDLIGIRILTELNSDCVNVFDLLKSLEFEQAMQGELISLDKEDLEEQPTIMRNGLEIYKIKGKYNSNHLFELQIKSKIIAAWGDLEHSVFYKDYSISPIRENTQATMNHIGKLLFQIDDFLKSVRESNKNYKENSDVISFLTEIDTKYTTVINESFASVSYRIDGFSELLFSIYERENIKQKIDDINPRLDTSHFLISPIEDINKKYFILRNKSNSLKIIESIYLTWLSQTQLTNSENLNDFITSYIELIANSVTDSLVTKYKNGCDREEIFSSYQHYFKLALNNNCEDGFLLNINEFFSLFTVLNNLIAQLETDIGTTKMDLMTDLLFISYYKGNIENFIGSVGFSEHIGKEDVKENLKWILEQNEKKKITKDTKIIKSTNKLLNKI